MPAAAIDPRYQDYMDKIRSRVCGVCLDSRNDRSCSLTERVCAIEAHLPRLVASLSVIASNRIDEYEAAIRAEVCPSCAQQDAQGQCTLRSAGDCALEAYLPLVLDAVEEVNAKRFVDSLAPTR
jgi:hypothetical protein